jgi:hypothetical protein
MSKEFRAKTVHSSQGANDKWLMDLKKLLLPFHYHLVSLLLSPSLWLILSLVINSAETGSLSRIEAESIQTRLPPCADTMACLRSSTSKLSSHVAYSLVR